MYTTQPDSFAHNQTDSHAPSPSEEAPSGTNAGGPKDQKTHPDFRSDGGDCKAFATLAATFSLAGFQLHRLTGGGILMSRWGLVREFENLGDATRFLRQIGGKA